MPDSCGSCGLAINRTNPAIQCQGSCVMKFHFKCTKLPPGITGDALAESGITWKCVNCTSTKTDKTDPILNQLLQKMDVLSNNMLEIKNNHTDIMKSLKFYGDKIDEFSKKIEKVDAMAKSVDGVINDISSLKTEYSQVRSELELLHQQGRMNNIEICGIPERKGENIISILKKVTEIINCPVESSEIVEIHRVMRFSVKDDNKNDSAHKNIVVKFSSKDVKDRIMQAVKVIRNKGLFINDINSNWSENERFYINEHLTPFFKLLYKKARQFCISNKYKYCWVKDAKIFIKKSDNNQAVLIKNEVVLNILGA